MACDINGSKNHAQIGKIFYGGNSMCCVAVSKYRFSQYEFFFLITENLFNQLTQSEKIICKPVFTTDPGDTRCW
jgi:hypothetical protein